MKEELIQALREDVAEYAKRRNGRIYAPIVHPAFADFAYEHGPERYEILVPHLPPHAKTVLDIGSHWGYFAHRFEEHGLDVTAVENNAYYLTFLERFRTLCDRRFTIYRGSIFTLRPLKYDVVLALNIFHHFVKDKSTYEEFAAFLRDLDCEVLFFQAHSQAEGQMRDAYLNPSPEEFCQLIVSQSVLTRAERIGVVGRRPIFKISR